jgi:zinc protease
MKNTIVSIFAGLILSLAVNAQIDRTQPPKPGPAPVINIGNYNTFSLPNGLKVIVVENHKTPVISWQLSLDIDPVMEGDAKGYVDLAGQLMKAGTKNRTKQQIDEETDFIGATLSPFSEGIYASSLTRHKEKLLDLMSDVLLNPVFPQEELEKLVEQSASALAFSENDAGFMVDNMISSVVYGEKHPYSEVVTPESLRKITRDHIANYHSSYFRPNTSYLVVVGDITVKEAKQLTETYFSKWTRGEVPKANYSLPALPSSNKVAFAHREGAVQSDLAVAYPVDLKPGAPDAIKVSVMNTILGGGAFAARLMQNLREEKAYTYGAYSSLSSDKLVGRFSARTEIANNVTDSALVQIIYEMERMVKETVDQKSLDLVKNFLSGSFARSLENPRTIANFALNIERYKLPKDYYATYLEKLAAVTAEDVRSMAGKYIKPANAWIIVAGSKEEVAPKLARFSQGNEILFYDSYGRKAEIKDTSIPQGITASAIIDSYIRAIGGAEKLKAINDQTIKMATEMQGMTIELTSISKAPGKVSVVTSVGGNPMQKQIFDGEKGVITAMGQKMVLTGKQLADMKMQAKMNPELEYEQLGFTAELAGMEDINGKPSYKVQITGPDGYAKTEYFDAESGLKMRTVSSQDTQMGPVTVTISYGDYREIDGLKFPFSVKQQAGPQALDMKVVSVEVNTGVSDDVFKIE